MNNDNLKPSPPNPWTESTLRKRLEKLLGSRFGSGTPPPKENPSERDGYDDPDYDPETSIVEMLGRGSQ